MVCIYCFVFTYHFHSLYHHALHLRSKQINRKSFLSEKSVQTAYLYWLLKQRLLYDIYRAVEGDKPLLHLDTDTNPDCGIGINIQFAIGDFYHEIQNMIDEKMKSITLQDIIDRYYFKIRNKNL